MADHLNGLELTTKDLALIEAALHTQKKILSVQSEAGRTGARRELTQLKHLIKRLDRNRCVPAAAASWLQTARSFLTVQTGCSHTSHLR